MSLEAERSEADLTILQKRWGGIIFIQQGHRPRQPQHPPRVYWMIRDIPHEPGRNQIWRAVQIHRSWAMRLRLEDDPEWRRTLNSYSLTYLLSGRGSLLTPSGVRPLQAGDLLVLFPGIPHAYGPPLGERWDEITLFFSGPLFDGWRGTPPLDPGRPVLRLEPLAYWRNRFQALLYPLARAPHPPGPAEWVRLLDLFSEIAAFTSPSFSESDRLWLEKAQAVLASLNRNHRLGWSEVARRLSVSERTLRRRFEQGLGLSPSRFHRERRIAEARRLLLETDQKIGAIAQALNYANEFHFSRQFKVVTGMTPRAYRLLHRNA